jgi:hypothetical protein
MRAHDREVGCLALPDAAGMDGLRYDLGAIFTG